jgi:XTP/dITP diphosphohydrolase
MKIYVMTANKHKLTEISAILAPLGVEVEIHPNYGDVEETGKSFEENAAIKATALPAPDGGYTLADDSGIAVDSLDGAPGIFSARYAGENASDEANRRLLLKNMEGEVNRRAAFVCVMALARDGRVEALFRGECEGSVGAEEVGEGGFGYDPVFVLPDGRSMATLSPEEKNAVSHRRRALDKLALWLTK